VAFIGDENVGCGPAFLQQEWDRACKSVAVSNRQNHLEIGCWKRYKTFESKQNYYPLD